MSTWVWIALGGVATLGLSAIVGLTLAAILGTIGREIGELLDTEPWTLAAPARAGRRRGPEAPNLKLG